MRYIPHSEAEIREMLGVIGASSVEDLFRSIPANNRCVNETPSPGLSEHELRKKLEGMASLNRLHSIFMAGSGAVFHAVPAAVDNIISRSEFLTAYTPYQPEISQGTLQVIFEFQSTVCELFGLDVSNASMYDGASALGEAVLMAIRVLKEKRRRVLISSAVNPNYLRVVRTMVESFGGIDIEMLPIDEKTGATIYPDVIDPDVAAVVAPYPGFFGVVENLGPVTEKCRAAGAISICTMTDIAHLSILKSPGELGFDIATGEGMGIAGTSGMGGPSLGLMACKDSYVKQMPGRIVGQTIDSNGQTGYVLTLATREQHIKREKATSNICSNQALVALAFTVHMGLLGRQGLRNMAAASHSGLKKLTEKLLSIPGVSRPLSGPIFNEIALSFDCDIDGLRKHLSDKDILFGVPVRWFYPDLPGNEKMIVLCITEIVGDEDIDVAVSCVSEYMEGLK